MSHAHLKRTGNSRRGALIIPIPPPPSSDPLLLWANGVLQCDFRDYAPLRSGAAFCQLLHLLYPQHIDLRLVRFHCCQLVEFILNYEYLQLGLARANIIFHVPVRRLILEEAATAEARKLLKWFHDVYAQRPPPRQPYNARQMRRQLIINYPPTVEQNIIWQYFFEMDARRLSIGMLAPVSLSHLPAVVYATQLSKLAVYVYKDKFGLASTEVERELIMVNNYSEYLKPAKYFWAKRDLVLDLERLRVQRSGSGLSSCIAVNRRRRPHCLPWQQPYLFPDELEALVAATPLASLTRLLGCLAHNCYPARFQTRLRRLFNVRIIVISYTEWMASLVNEQCCSSQSCRAEAELLLVVINLNATDINDLSHWSKPARVDRFKPRRVLRLRGYLGDRLHVLRGLCERREISLVPTTLSAALPLTEPIEGAHEDRLAQCLEDWVMGQPRKSSSAANLPQCILS